MVERENSRLQVNMAIMQRQILKQRNEAEKSSNHVTGRELPRSRYYSAERTVVTVSRVVSRPTK